MPSIPPLPPSSGKEWRLRPLNRGDREAAFKLLAGEGWIVPALDQESVLSWVVQHPEMESFVAHDTFSYRPQLRLGGRVASIDLFVVEPEQRNRGIGHDLLAQAMRRAEALACKRIEILLPEARSERHGFFENYGFVNNGNDLWIRKIAQGSVRTT